MCFRKVYIFGLVGIVVLVTIFAPITAKLFDQTRIRQSIETLESSNELGACYKALDHLTGAGIKAHVALSILLKAIEDPDAGIRWRSAVALAHVAQGESSVIRALENGLLDPDHNVRMFSISSLAHVRPLDEGSVDKLLPFVMDKEPDLRLSAIQALGHYTVFPSKVETIFEAQKRLTRDENSEVRRIACYSLGVYGSNSDREEIVDELIRMLDDRVYNVRWQAIDALGKIGSRSRSALKRLEEIERNNEEEPEIKETARIVIDAIRTKKKYKPKYTYKHLIR
jgi:HEAT repeat protein